MNTATRTTITAAIAAIDAGTVSTTNPEVADADRRYLAGALDDDANGRGDAAQRADAVDIAAEYTTA